MLIPSAHDPFRSPAWRFQRAIYLAAKSKRLTRHDDPWTRTATHFARRLGRCRTAQEQQRLAQHEPYLHQAYRVYCSGSTRLRTELEARLLAAEPVEQISRKCAIPEQTVTCYEGLFYSVKESLPHHAYIVNVVIQLPSDRGEQDLSKVVRLLGYGYGPLFLDGVLKVLGSPLALPASWHQLEEWQRTELCTELSCRLCLAARMVPFQPRTAVQILRLGDQLEALRTTAEISAQKWQTFATKFRQITDAWSPSWEDHARPQTVISPVTAHRAASQQQAGDSGLAEGESVKRPLDSDPDNAAGPEPRRNKVPNRRRRQRKRTPAAA